jgi:RimJ/RimL family protein N-acetyltransferase
MSETVAMDRIVETPRLFVRHWEWSDAGAFARLAGDPRVMRFISGEPWTLERMHRFAIGGAGIGRLRGWCFWPVFLKKGGEFIGISGFGANAPSLFGLSGEVDLGWWLRPEHWGRGLATEAARALLAYGFERLKFPQIFAIAHVLNRPSIRVMVKLGMDLYKVAQRRDTQVVIFRKTVNG